MTIDAYLASLKDRHAELDHAIEAESHRPLPDSMVIQALKRRKLRIKDEMVRLRGATRQTERRVRPEPHSVSATHL